MKLQVGDKAPAFKLLSDQNELVSLQQFLGKKIILYFYPKDNTPGCNREACDFRDAISQFQKNNIEIIGISKDTPKKHQQFKKKFGLPFMLLSDETGETCQTYGVINKKSLFGNTFLGIERSTFFIDEKGYIRAIWRKVKVQGHVDAILDTVLTQTIKS